MTKENILAIQAAASALAAYLSDRLGLLFPVLGLLLVAMILDYGTGMAAARVEALDHPGDPNFGWSSKKGARGIAKKVGYMCVIAVAMIVDYVLLYVAAQLGIAIPTTAFFGLLVAVWYLLNELLSITENAGRMGADVPEWLSQYIAVLRDKVDNTEHKA